MATVISSLLGDPSRLEIALAPLIPFLLGGLAERFKFLIGSDSDFKRDVSRVQEHQRDRLAATLATLLNHSRTVFNSKELRGDGHNEPDLVGDYTRKILKVYESFHRLEALRRARATGERILLAITLISPLVVFFGSLWFPVSRICVIGYVLLALLVEAFTIWILKSGCDKLSVCERDIIVD